MLGQSFIEQFVIHPQDADDDWLNASYSDPDLDVSEHPDIDTAPGQTDDEDFLKATRLNQVGYFDVDGVPYGHVYTRQTAEKELKDDQLFTADYHLPSPYRIDNEESGTDADDEDAHPNARSIFAVMNEFHAFTMKKRVDEANQKWSKVEDKDANGNINQRCTKVQFNQQIEYYSVEEPMEDGVEGSRDADWKIAVIKSIAELPSDTDYIHHLVEPSTDVTSDPIFPEESCSQGVDEILPILPELVNDLTINDQAKSGISHVPEEPFYSHNIVNILDDDKESIHKYYELSSKTPGVTPANSTNSIDAPEDFLAKAKTFVNAVPVDTKIKQPSETSTSKPLPRIKMKSTNSPRSKITNSIPVDHKEITPFTSSASTFGYSSRGAKVSHNIPLNVSSSCDKLRQGKSFDKRPLHTSSANSGSHLSPAPVESPRMNPILKAILDPKNLSNLTRPCGQCPTGPMYRELKTQILKHNVQKASLQNCLSKKMLSYIFNDTAAIQSTSFQRETLSSKSKIKGARCQSPSSCKGSSKWASKPEFNEKLHLQTDHLSNFSKVSNNKVNKMGLAVKGGKPLKTMDGKRPSYSEKGLLSLSLGKDCLAAADSSVFAALPHKSRSATVVGRTTNKKATVKKTPKYISNKI